MSWLTTVKSQLDKVRAAHSARNNLNQRRSFFEPLEQRRMLSVIIWDNLDDVDFSVFEDPDTPEFEALMARNAVIAASERWERVIVDFNHSADFGGGPDLTLTLTIVADDNGCSASAAATEWDDAGKPVAGYAVNP